MLELKTLLSEKNFVISPLILKYIHRYNLTMDEFLLLLYFINVECSLDLDKIKRYFSFSDEVILDTFNSLIAKKVIELVVTKEDGKVTERISLDILYDGIILNSDNEPSGTNESDIYACFEKEFGRTLSPIEYETISNWLGNNIDEKTIKAALKEAVLNGVSNLRYIDKILYEWTKKGGHSHEASVEEKKVELFDYNWLDE